MAAADPAAPAAAAARSRRTPLLWVTVALLTPLVLAWGAAVAWAVWADLDGAEREALRALLEPRRAIVMLFVLLLPLLLAAAAAPWVRGWPRAAQRLREEVAIVTATHAGHGVTVAGAREMRELATAIDGLARAHASLRAEVDARIAESNARAAEEARRLAALMSELTQGVLVCNRDGRILLYNPRASALLDPQGSGRVGLGRAAAGLLDAQALEHAWQQVLRRAEQRSAHPVAHFVTRLRGGAETSAAPALLRVQMVPTQGEAAELGGYVLIVDDITRSVEDHSRRDTALQRLTEGTRSALGNLRAAAQTLRQYPAMDAARRERFTDVIHDEAERLARQLGEALGDAGGAGAVAWPLEDMQAGDLIFALQRSLQSGPGIGCRYEGGGAARWLEVDSHSLVQSMSHLIGRIGAELDVGELAVGVHEGERFVRIEFGWQGPALDPARLTEWERATQGAAAPGGALRDVLDRHGAELWVIGQRLCLQLPAARSARAAAAPVRGRPIYYDFDLFNQRGQTAALDQMPLAALSYTVFDTETTGLRPSEGDEIIAIGAVRIVNARLLDNETFDRLTKPRRAVRESARAVHGIGPEQLEGQPPLEEVLPPFARFCEDTVLVAHNAAFDMRFLELARERCGVRFDQPVLDTLLLSTVVQPAHRADEHHLEQIAERLGVPVAGRHSALGDAVVTARVFLKLLPLLAERGIITLAQARAASQRSAQAHETF